MFIYYCQKFIRKLERQTPSIQSIVNERISQLKNRDTCRGIGSIGGYGNLYVLYILGANTCRIIMQEEQIDINEGQKVTILFIRDFVEKSGFDYNWPRIQGEISRKEWLILNPLNTEDKNRAIDNYLKQASKTESIPDLPDEYAYWTNDFEFKVFFDVYETEEWVNYSSDGASKGLKSYYLDHFRLTLLAALQLRLGNIDLLLINGESQSYACIHKEFEVGIIFSIYNGNIFILKNGAHIKEQKDRWDDAILNEKNTPLIFNSHQTLSKVSLRAYPKKALLNNELWFAIQQRGMKKSNLSLMPEQVDFLNSFKFPKYINGQAGSGKSTMLAYLFANAYYYQLLDLIPGNIVFITENQNLLNDSEKNVFDLLSYNPEFDGALINDRLKIRSNFFTFKDLLTNILPEEERLSFSGEYLEFSKFKNLYLEAKHLAEVRRRLSAEVSWFVLSTYINGYDVTKQITTWDELDKYDKEIIDKDTFNLVIQKVMPFYDGLLKDGYWDKVKLIKFIKNNGIPIDRKYTLIICDEAQDFSKVELSFILNLSVYLDYQPLITQVNQIPLPIVFAGDALQTVSPTGFNKARLTTMFFEELKKLNYYIPYIDNKPDLEFTPTYNYRSAQAVVYLANLIQAYREKVLSAKDIFPQIAKRKLFEGRNHHYAYTKDFLLQNNTEYKRLFEHKIFIIPVDLDEEAQYKINEPLIKDFANIKSAINSKGIEYPQVVVYGFGEAYLNQFEHELSWQSNIINLFKKQFFFNKLYVAITRSSDELIIIDTPQGIDKFWKPLMNNKENISDKWTNNICDCIQFDVESLAKEVLESSPDDASRYAERDKAQGILENSPSRLKIAADVFAYLGKMKEANDCYGLSEKIKGNYNEAVKWFIKSENMEQLSDCYWLLQDWGELRKVLSNNLLDGNISEIRRLVSKLMQYGAWETQEMEKVYALRNLLPQQLRNISWRTNFMHKLIEFVIKEHEVQNKRDLIAILESLPNNNEYYIWDTIGQLYFETRQYQEAINVWDKNNNDDEPKSINYIKASIEIAKDKYLIPVVILWSGRLEKQTSNLTEQQGIRNKIIADYEANKPEVTNSEVYDELISYLLKAYLFKGNTSMSVQFAKEFEVKYSNEEQQEFYSSILMQIQQEDLFVFVQERWAKSYCKKNDLLSNLNNESWLTSLNKRFSIYALPEWTWSELEKISDVPKPINPQPSEHFHTVEIKNFRNLIEVRIENCGLFNLILGDNNVGKTSLLEAFMFSPDPNSLLSRLLYLNNQRKNSNKLDILNNILNSFKNASNTESPIEIKLIENRRSWSYSIIEPSPQTILELARTDKSNSHDYILVQKKEEEINLNNLSSPATQLNDYLNDSAELVKIPFVPFGKGFSSELADMYDKFISVNSLDEEFIDILKKTFIPNIKSINVDTKNGFIRIREQNGNTMMLHNYGEGANKVFRILLLIYVNKGKRLMIDEIDAGIHHTRFQEFWTYVLKTASVLQVQLFVTTHNYECIEYFNQVLDSVNFSYLQKEARVIEMKMVANKLKARTFSFGDLKFSIQNDIEIRGGHL